MMTDGDDDVTIVESIQPQRTVIDLTDTSGIQHKNELRKILNAFQFSRDFGIYVCEDFKDPRRFYMDDYWFDVEHSASGICDLGQALDFRHPNHSLTDDARKQFNRFARTLERITKRIDRVIMHPDEDPEKKMR